MDGGYGRLRVVPAVEAAVEAHGKLGDIDQTLVEGTRKRYRNGDRKWGSKNVPGTMKLSFFWHGRDRGICCSSIP